jgi:predicted ester cyclase
MTGEKLNREYVADNALIIDEIMTGNVVGSMLGLPGHDREISFRILHVFEFKDGLISRENVWLDGGAIAAQLSSPADH